MTHELVSPEIVA